MAERAAHNRPVGGSSPPAPTTGGSATEGEAFRWSPYSFKAYERYIYSYRERLRGEERSGGMEILIRRVEGRYRILFRGSYGKWNGSAERDFRSAEEVAGWVLMRMYFDYHWLIPVGRTVFSRGLVRMLLSREIDWTPGRKRTEDGLLRVVRECRAGNLKGRLLELLRDSEALFRLCASESASLPVLVYRRTDEGDLYEIRLTEYSDIK